MKNPHQSWSQSGRTPLTLSPRKRKDPVFLPLGVGSHSYLIRGQNCRRFRNSLRLRIITAGPRTACKRSGMNELSWDVSSATSDRNVVGDSHFLCDRLGTHSDYRAEQRVNTQFSCTVNTRGNLMDDGIQTANRFKYVFLSPSSMGMRRSHTESDYVGTVVREQKSDFGVVLFHTRFSSL